MGKNKENEAAIGDEFEAQYMKKHKHLKAEQLRLRRKRFETSKDDLQVTKQKEERAEAGN